MRGTSDPSAAYRGRDAARAWTSDRSRARSPGSIASPPQTTTFCDRVPRASGEHARSASRTASGTESTSAAEPVWNNGSAMSPRTPPRTSMLFSASIARVKFSGAGAGAGAGADASAVCTLSPAGTLAGATNASCGSVSSSQSSVHGPPRSPTVEAQLASSSPRSSSSSGTSSSDARGAATNRRLPNLPSSRPMLRASMRPASGVVNWQLSSG
eukprot:Amastigsp_a179142_5.p2 type:complete len:213 gc:universal Amastigsp_a179142_5:1146-508(-)